MTNIENIRTFKDLSEKHSTWIIKYCSENFDKPIFMIWYRDNSETEHILSYKNGGIFTSKTLVELRKKIQSEKNELFNSENINQWLENTKEMEMVESSTYDLISVINNLKENILDIKTTEGFADFISLFDDYINQDEKNNYLQKYIDNELIKKTWKYYYKFIFWPRFNDKEKFELWNRPKLEIDKIKLLTKFKDVVLKFENNMNRKPFANRVARRDENSPR
ncbi:hypothetical protein [uncultured Dokdonia sp.]|uniref:hypothetical protein n=1 Tax=uncultured Dokdonia sp. TaxID=575653 RepID=UPI0026131E51|nr:hypothetical protein [uncultured Dokdonia sp.]